MTSIYTHTHIHIFITYIYLIQQIYTSYVLKLIGFALIDKYFIIIYFSLTESVEIIQGAFSYLYMLLFSTCLFTKLLSYFISVNSIC